jgi:hypothetical protein
MDDTQPRNVTEFRQKVFQFVQRNQAALEVTQLTLFKLLQMIVSLACALPAIPLAQAIGDGLAGWGGWRWIVVIVAGLLMAIVGFVVGFLPFYFLERWRTKRMIRRIETGGDADLWKIVDLGLWNFEYALALLQLGARGQDVQRELPVVLNRMASIDRQCRRYGWDALRLVFYDEAESLGGYDPNASAEDCMAKVKHLVAGMSAADRAALTNSIREQPPLSKWQIIRLTDTAQISADRLLSHLYRPS